MVPPLACKDNTRDVSFLRSPSSLSQSMLRSLSKQRAKVASAEASAEASHLLSDLRVVGAQNDRFVQEALDRENAVRPRNPAGARDGGPRVYGLGGDDYIRHLLLPDFFFHISIAHSIL